ncbi:MAG: transglutaminase domain-containing protein, partial [Clostridia bacterium]|nr:transglutaminase domain-containing protein [Clostridia bacterium]
RKVRWLAIVTAVLPAAVALLSGLRPTMPAFIFYVVAALFYLILLETRSKGTARRLTWLNGELSAAMLIFLVLLALLLSGFERSENVEELRQQIAQRVTAFRYAPNETVDGMPGGDLNEAGALQYTGKTVLTVETPDAFSMYLRGYSGDVLEDGKWVPLDSDAYFDDYSLTGPWIRSNYFSPAVSLGQLLDLKWQVQTTQYENGEREAMNLPRYPIKVRNELAFSDRMYAPYEVSAESKGLHHAELSQNGILSEGLRGKRSYELTVYRPLTKDYGNVSPKALIGEDAPYNSLYEDAFVPVEKVYRAFAQANERDIPEQYQGVMSELGAAVVGKTTKVSDATYRIRNYFTKNYQYSLDVAEPEPGQDPLLRFLESRTGYCTHFATLATLLYREAGIPARYAEGYFISEELAGSVEKETDVTLSVPDSAAHAWVEVYLDGVGWVPVEVTPGYFDTQNSSSGSSPQGQTVQPEETPQPEDNEDNDSEDGGGQDEEEAEEPEKQEKHHNFGWLILLIPLF